MNDYLSAKIIGYWANDSCPWLPQPQRLVDHSWDPVERRAVIDYLRGGLEWA